MNRAQMEHYNILKPSLERFGKCQWNIKVYKRNRGIAASCEDFPEAEDIFIPRRNRQSWKRSIDTLLWLFSILFICV